MVMKPPSGGPITGPTSAGTVTQAMAFTSALLSIERNSTSRPTGVIIAPPMPCRMRAITKSVTEPDSAQPIEPAMKTATARGEYQARAEAVGGPAAGRNEHRERQEIRGDGELQRQRAGADIGGDRRQRRRNHRRIHVLHEQGGGDDERDQAFFVHRRYLGKARKGRMAWQEMGSISLGAAHPIGEPANRPQSAWSAISMVSEGNFPQSFAGILTAPCVETLTDDTSHGSSA